MDILLLCSIYLDCDWCIWWLRVWREVKNRPVSTQIPDHPLQLSPAPSLVIEYYLCDECRLLEPVIGEWSQYLWSNGLMSDFGWIWERFRVIVLQIERGRHINLLYYVVVVYVRVMIWIIPVLESSRSSMCKLMVWRERGKAVLERLWVFEHGSFKRICYLYHKCIHICDL